MDLVTFDLVTRNLTPFVATPFAEDSGRFSPDGKWIAYQADESGRFEISVQPFPPDGTKVQISTGGGESPRWSTDGRTLYYVGRDRILTSVPLVFGPSGPEVGAPRRHMRMRSVDYELGADGQSAIVAPTDAATQQPIIVVTNWQRK